ncbi:hypothetical protein HYS29_00490 [Candidatus Microgenomates bacterium]|nr:hypothetical protein [Candidatus Microgenomates bacterium]MBI2622211.1 hypothetical protein [Candidatus Microgenomates bacterium]
MVLEARDFFHQFYPPDMRARTKRSTQAQEIGAKVLERIEQLREEADRHLKERKVTNQLWLESYALERILLVVFGVPSPRGHDYYFSHVLSTHPNQNQSFPLAELDPAIHGCIAAVHIGEEDGFLRDVLAVSNDVYRSTDEGIFYRTCLTESDGIVWLESENRQNGQPDPAIVIFPINKVLP